ncbi:DUF4403 family protein [Portibacter lacus]|uniref:DUF4403 family protein n=1 Tax=Portibacter lacus TaxID=1099794 RepID=A0AA37SYK3_9BACT|nr:DUF4403 family protein [Portibacter lacus]GLR20073.1 hypothetical protein GCM10007940_46890 [Portibacter lacus]
MAIVNLKLTYPQLSELLQIEANKQDINVKGYDIKISKFVIGEENGKLRITGELVSKWNAYFDFSAIPSFISDENKLDLQDIKLDLDASNLIFKGILKLAKGNVIKRLEKIIEQPLNEQIEIAKTQLDAELSKAPLPYNLKLYSNTKSIEVLELQALQEYLFIQLKMEQEININFANPTST